MIQENVQREVVIRVVSIHVRRTRNEFINRELHELKTLCWNRCIHQVSILGESPIQLAKGAPVILKKIQKDLKERQKIAEILSVGRMTWLEGVSLIEWPVQYSSVTSRPNQINKLEMVGTTEKFLESACFFV